MAARERGAGPQGTTRRGTGRAGGQRAGPPRARSPLARGYASPTSSVAAACSRGHNGTHPPALPPSARPHSPAPPPTSLLTARRRGNAPFPLPPGGAQWRGRTRPLSRPFYPGSGSECLPPPHTHPLSATPYWVLWIVRGGEGERKNPAWASVSNWCPASAPGLGGGGPGRSRGREGRRQVVTPSPGAWGFPRSIGDGCRIRGLGARRGPRCRSPPPGWWGRWGCRCWAGRAGLVFPPGQTLAVLVPYPGPSSAQRAASGASPHGLQNGARLPALGFFFPVGFLVFWSPKCPVLLSSHGVSLASGWANLTIPGKCRELWCHALLLFRQS